MTLLTSKEAALFTLLIANHNLFSKTLISRHCNYKKELTKTMLIRVIQVIKGMTTRFII